jgi:hypothetical protein
LDKELLIFQPLRAVDGSFKSITRVSYTLRSILLLYTGPV